MAPVAVDQASALEAEDVRPAPSGVVKPPRDIQAIVEKTAGYVHRNGKVFENRIRDKEKDNPKFSFLNSDDAYAPFYAWRLQEISEGRGTVVSAGRAGEAAGSAASEKSKAPAAPPEFRFSARMPNISAQDLDVVRLTALFVAKNGKSFLNTLVQKENRNFQFDFLRPQHSLHQFFSRLVDQYTTLLQSTNAQSVKAQRAQMYDLGYQAKNKLAILDRAKQRAEWIKYQEKQKMQKEEAAQQEQVEYAQIDWHDFVVVETVLFDAADEQAELPPPTSLNDLQSASLEQKAAMSLQPHDRRIEEAMPTDQDPRLFSNPLPQAQVPPGQFVGHPPPVLSPGNGPMNPNPVQTQPPQSFPQAPMAAVPPSPPTFSEEDQAISERAREREQMQAAQAAARAPANQPVRIREDYVPRAKALRSNVQTAICPNCKQSIPYDELEQHMKIELLDPRWKEQRQKADSRAMMTNLSTSDVAANLKRLASQRSDVFDGVTGQPVLTPEEEARRKRAAINVFDGNLDSSMGSANAAAKKAMAAASAERNSDDRNKAGSIEEQLRRIHEKAKG